MDDGKKKKKKEKDWMEEKERECEWRSGRWKVWSATLLL